MHYLSLALTVVLAGIFFYVTGGSWMSAGRVGGPLLVRVVRPARQFARIAAAVFGALLIGTWGLILTAMVHMDVPPWTIASPIANFFITLWIAVMVVRATSRPFEIRQKGLVLSIGGRGAFMPWAQVEFCKWRKPTGTLLVQCHDRNFSYRLPPAQVEPITAALTGHVQLLDVDDAVLAPAPYRPPRNEPVTWSEPGFQFRLSTLLLLALVISAASGWFGTLMHQVQRRQAALEGMKAFEPHARYEATQLVELSFSRPTMLGDDDLPAIAQCARLRSLDLARTRVTDAGLAHLEGLAELEHLDLRFTQVTDTGVRRLQAALPKAEIYH